MAVRHAQGRCRTGRERASVRRTEAESTQSPHLSSSCHWSPGLQQWPDTRGFVVKSNQSFCWWTAISQRCSSSAWPGLGEFSDTEGLLKPPVSVVTVVHICPEVSAVSGVSTVFFLLPLMSGLKGEVCYHQGHQGQAGNTRAGNHMLLRVLPSVYPKDPDIIHRHLGSLTAMVPQLEPAEQQHLLKLLQMVAEQHPLMLSPQVPALVAYLGDRHLAQAVMATLVGVSQASPSSLLSFLPVLRAAGQQSPALLGHVSRVHAAVGIISERHARTSLLYLLSLLGSTEHACHHSVLQEIRALSERFPALVGGSGKDVYRLSNSFSAIARQLGRRLEESGAASCRSGQDKGRTGASEQGLQLELQNCEEKSCEEEEEAEEEEPPAPQRRLSLSQAVREERREMRFNRSKSLAIAEVRSRSANLDSGEDGEAAEHRALICSTERQEVASPERKPTGDEPSVAVEEEGDEGPGREKEEQVESDRLFQHLRDNMENISQFCGELLRRIPVPEQCVIEGSARGCLARLSFSCPLKGHYCLYSKSCFVLTSRRPHLWLHLMLLHQQSRASAPLCSTDPCVGRLAALWEKTRLKGAHSFAMAVTQQTTPGQKDLDSLQSQLEDVRFFDLFGFSAEEGAWLCFMCNHPDKAAGVNQGGQPLMEGKLKEKQVRWKFIKRWKTRYFTLAGNQLLFRKAKSRDELDDVPIELSKVQSVKVVARKRRDRGLPRAFEIFTEDKTYVLKAEDEKHTEEWLQCINVAVAQARERENREATTYL
ncbi:ventricular zone-expressed PH domain-containing protein isoform X2 [Synchiropus splendidus]|uniref:ventricular zone-expressed PH domain-containing protein isoform X2 n=1 Tax=Synchiropus splendidus TaxID=270530 RepID=UPI00237ECCE8|nr:ventricular zone-expressed PH domain-containing protein isoform X2 [Synchiropus splendidus]